MFIDMYIMYTVYIHPMFAPWLKFKLSVFSLRFLVEGMWKICGPVFASWHLTTGNVAKG